MSKKAEARERVKAMREEQLRKERRRERTLRFGIAGAVLAAVVIIAVAVNASKGGGGAADVPSAVSEDGNGIVVGEADAPVTIDSWLDLKCPACQQFELTNGETVDELVGEGTAKVIYHPLNWHQDSEVGNNALACAANEGNPTEFLQAAFGSQSEWSSDDDIAAIGKDAGVGGDFESCVKDGTYKDWTDDVTGSAQDAGVEGTPTLFIDGPAYDEPQVMEGRTPDAIRQAVEAAAG